MICKYCSHCHNYTISSTKPTLWWPVGMAHLLLTTNQVITHPNIYGIAGLLLKVTVFVPKNWVSEFRLVKLVTHLTHIIWRFSAPLPVIWHFCINKFICIPLSVRQKIFYFLQICQNSWESDRKKNKLWHLYVTMQPGCNPSTQFSSKEEWVHRKNLLFLVGSSKKRDYTILYVVFNQEYLFFNYKRQWWVP